MSIDSFLPMSLLSLLPAFKEVFLHLRYPTCSHTLPAFPTSPFCQQSTASLPPSTIPTPKTPLTFHLPASPNDYCSDYYQDPIPTSNTSLSAKSLLKGWKELYKYKLLLLSSPPRSSHWLQYFLPYLKRERHPKTPSGCLKVWIVSNPPFPYIYSYTHLQSLINKSSTVRDYQQ